MNKKKLLSMLLVSAQLVGCTTNKVQVEKITEQDKETSVQSADDTELLPNESEELEEYPNIPEQEDCDHVFELPFVPVETEDVSVKTYKRDDGVTVIVDENGNITLQMQKAYRNNEEMAKKILANFLKGNKKDTISFDMNGFILVNGRYIYVCNEQGALNSYDNDNANPYEFMIWSLDNLEDGKFYLHRASLEENTRNLNYLRDVDIYLANELYGYLPKQHGEKCNPYNCWQCYPTIIKADGSGVIKQYLGDDFEEKKYTGDIWLLRSALDTYYTWHQLSTYEYDAKGYLKIDGQYAYVGVKDESKEGICIGFADSLDVEYIADISVGSTYQGEQYHGEVNPDLFIGLTPEEIEELTGVPNGGVKQTVTDEDEEIVQENQVVEN